MITPVERRFVDTKRTFKKLRPTLIRVAMATTIFVMLLLIIALVVDRWIIVLYPDAFYEKRIDKYISDATLGAMSFCYREVSQKKDETKYHHCTYFWLMPTRKIQNDPFTDQSLASLRQTEFAFIVIMFIFLLISMASGFYSVRVYRYMYKRFAAIMYFITAISMLVCIELVNHMVRQCRESGSSCYPTNARHHASVSTYLMWICFVLTLTCSALLLVCSSKLKGANAANELEEVENAPFELRR